MSSLAIHEQPVILFAEECERPANREESEISVLNVRLALADMMLVADGSGSNGGGAAASRMVVEHFYAHLAGLPPDYPVDNAIRAAAARANASILAAASTPGSQLQGARVSMVVALLQQEGEITYAWIGHIGDSRAYLQRAGRLHRLTVDHTAVQEMLDRKMITPFEALHHPDAKVLSRSLGQQLAVDIEVEQVPLAVGDTLLLCSDSLWRSVPEAEIQSAADSETADSAAHSLLALALAADGKDSVGIELARMILPPDTRPQRAHSPFALDVVITVFLIAFAGVAALILYLM
ncbi:MAG: protein phosphatase 2C domain-containing protein [Terracidiphilus sp.]